MRVSRNCTFHCSYNNSPVCILLHTHVWATVMGEGHCLARDEGKTKCQTSEVQKQINDLINVNGIKKYDIYNLGQCEMQSMGWG